MKRLPYIFSITAILITAGITLFKTQVSEELSNNEHKNKLSTDNLSQAHPPSLLENSSSEKYSINLSNYLPKRWNIIYQKYKLSTDRDEKLELIGALTSLAANLSDSEVSSSALSKILEIATTEEDPEAKSFAIINYSRIGDPKIAVDLLKSSSFRNVIDDETYHSELARIFFRSTPQERVNINIIDEIVTSKNGYTAEVIFARMPHSDASEFTESDVQKLNGYLNSNRPHFPEDFTSLGVIDTIIYRNWIRSVAFLSTKGNRPEDTAIYLLDHYKNGFLDPREAVSLVLADSFAKMEQTPNIVALRKQLWDEAMKYAESYPDNPVVQILTVPADMGR